MKNSLYILLTLLLISGLPACRKEKKPLVIAGRIVTDCNGTPYANASISIYQPKNGGLFYSSKGGTLLTTTTDSDGYFLCKYVPESSESVSIDGFLDGIPLKDVNVGEVNANRTGSFRIFLDPGTSVYTAQDTLFYTNFNYPNNPFPNTNYRYVVGPFAAGQIDSITGMGLSAIPVYGKSPYPITITYFLNSNPSEMSQTTVTPGTCNDWGSVTFTLP